jgi:hypothetical protein
LDWLLNTRKNFIIPPSPIKEHIIKELSIKIHGRIHRQQKFDSKNQLTGGIAADLNKLKLRNDYIPDGDSVSSQFYTRKNAALLKGFVNFAHRFQINSTNIGLYQQLFTLNNSYSIEPRWNLKYQFRYNQSFSIGAGLHSQTQPLEVYFYETKRSDGTTELTNKDLDFVKSVHGVLGYDISFSKHLRLKAEAYGQYIYNAAVQKEASSFSMLNAGADFYFPDKTNLVNGGNGYNYGLELTLERFLHRGFYYLITVTLFESNIGK